MRNDVKNLENIIELINNVFEAMHQYGSDIDDFLSTPIYKAGCTMYLMQIGEYAKNLSDELTETHKNIDWDGLKGLRNIIAHRYEHINYNLIWEFITKELPAVREECVVCLNEIKN